VCVFFVVQEIRAISIPEIENRHYLWQWGKFCPQNAMPVSSAVYGYAYPNSRVNIDGSVCLRL